MVKKYFKYRCQQYNKAVLLEMHFSSSLISYEKLKRKKSLSQQFLNQSVLSKTLIDLRYSFNHINLASFVVKQGVE